MNDERMMPDAQAQAMLDEIDSKARERSDTLISSAKVEAERIIKAAHKDARIRMCDVIARLRKECETAIARQTARLELDERLKLQEQASQLVRLGWPLIEEAVRGRWENVAARKVWIDETLRIAAAFLPDGAWCIHAPQNLPLAEKNRVKERAEQVPGVRVEWVADPGIAAGLRIMKDGAVLDTTSDGLLADTQTMNAMLLAELRNLETTQHHMEPVRLRRPR